MNHTSVKLIKILCKTNKIRKDKLQEKLQLQDWQFSKTLRDLKKDQMIDYDSLFVKMADTKKSVAIYYLSLKYDLTNLLQNANDKVLAELETGKTLDKIMNDTQLSRATVYRAFADFEEVGILKKILTVKVDNNLTELIETLKNSE